MESSQGEPQNKIEKFIERLNSDPQYFNHFIENPAGVFGEDITPLPQDLQTQFNEYVKKKLKEMPPKTLTFTEEDNRNIIKIIITMYLG